MQQIGEQHFTVGAPFLDRLFGPSRKFGEHPRASDKSGDTEERVPASLSQRCGSSAGAIAYQRKARAEKEPPMMLDPIRVGLMCRFTLAKWCNGNTPIMPTTIAVSMIFATVQS